jgi:hypothetical protein
VPPAWQRIFRTNAISNALPASAAETVIATLIVNDAGADTAIELKGWAKITTGASTTSIVLRIRRNGVAGPLVGEAQPLNIIGAVGETHEYGDQVVDNPGEVASQTYVLTCVQTAASAAGTLAAVLLEAITP